MNDLNAQQIVLLTLLVSFVTSIATGIVTVSLLEQAPDPVTQTINRVVERTVERVVPQDEDEEKDNDNVTIVRTPEREIVTVVVREEDLTIEAVSKNARSIARIYTVDIMGNRTFAAIGTIVNSSGVILTDAQRILPNTRHVLVYPSGEFESEIIFREISNSPYALLRPRDVPSDRNFDAATFGNSQNLKLAQSVISLSGRNTNTVSMGIIKSLYTDSGALDSSQVGASNVPDQPIRLIETTVDSTNVLSGSILLNLQGEIIGFRIGSNLTDPNDYRPSDMIKDFLSSRNL